MKKMKKSGILLILACVLCACGKEADSKYSASVFKTEPTNMEQKGTEVARTNESKKEESKDLRFLCSPDSDSPCHTDEGYYYLTVSCVCLLAYSC